MPGHVFIERLWRSLKYELICPGNFQSGDDLFQALDRYQLFLQLQPGEPRYESAFSGSIREHDSAADPDYHTGIYQSQLDDAHGHEPQLCCGAEQRQDHSLN